jgi:hypothetical protein
MAVGSTDFSYTIPINDSDLGITVQGSADITGRVVFLDPTDLGKVSLSKQTMQSDGTFAGKVQGVNVSGTYATDPNTLEASGSRTQTDVYQSTLKFRGTVDAAISGGGTENGNLRGTIQSNLNFRTAKAAGSVAFDVTTPNVDRSFSNNFQDRLITFSSAGFQPPNATLGGVSGRVYVDLNRDGIENTAEKGAVNYAVELWRSTDNQIGNADDVSLESAVTDADGYYAFNNLATGDYYLKIALPSKYELSPVGGSTNRAIDSDFLPGDAHTALMRLNGGQPALDIDAAVRPLVPWHNFDIQYDVDGDGKVFNVDVVTLVNYLNRGWDGELPDPTAGDPPPYLDVSPDNRLEPLDVVLVVNELNRLSRGSGEGASQSAAGTTVPTDFPSLTQALDRANSDLANEVYGPRRQSQGPDFPSLAQAVDRAISELADEAYGPRRRSRRLG